MVHPVSKRQHKYQFLSASGPQISHYLSFFPLVFGDWSVDQDLWEKMTWPFRHGFLVDQIAAWELSCGRPLQQESLSRGPAFSSLNVLRVVAVTETGWRSWTTSMCAARSDGTILWKILLIHRSDFSFQMCWFAWHVWLHPSYSLKEPWGETGASTACMLGGVHWVDWVDWVQLQFRTFLRKNPL